VNNETGGSPQEARRFVDGAFAVIFAPLVRLVNRIFGRKAVPKVAPAVITGPLATDADPASLIQRVEAVEQMHHHLVAVETRVRDLEAEVDVPRMRLAELEDCR
jgi:hypothetical protein